MGHQFVPYLWKVTHGLRAGREMWHETHTVTVLNKPFIISPCDYTHSVVSTENVGVSALGGKAIITAND